VADALAQNRAADLAEVGIMGPAAVAIAGFFGNLDAEENLELGPVPVPVAVLLPEPDLEPEPEPEQKPDPEPEQKLEQKPELEPEQKLKQKPEPEPPPEPMAGFDEAAVLAWVAAVPGLTAAERAAAAEMMAEDECDGPQPYCQNLE
jgi:outer membrane biosynthesis protein TonB